MNPVALCGTPSGANRHRRIGEPVCGACRAGAAKVSRKYKAESRSRRQAALPAEDLAWSGGWVRTGNVLRPAPDGASLESFGEWAS